MVSVKDKRRYVQGVTSGCFPNEVLFDRVVCLRYDGAIVTLDIYHAPITTFY